MGARIEKEKHVFFPRGLIVGVDGLDVAWFFSHGLWAVRDQKFFDCAISTVHHWYDVAESESTLKISFQFEKFRIWRSIGTGNNFKIDADAESKMRFFATLIHSVLTFKYLLLLDSVLMTVLKVEVHTSRSVGVDSGRSLNEFRK